MSPIVFLSALVAFAAVSFALPAATGQMMYYQQVHPMYRQYRPYQQYRPVAAGGNNKFLRRSAEELAANDAYLQDEEQQYVLGDGEIAVPAADPANAYADEPAAVPQDVQQDELPSFQGDPEQPQQDEQPLADAPIAADQPTKARRPAAKKAAAPAPHTFFPMTFGNTNGASLAVANAFSTGKGSAASHAVAYGAKRA